MVSLTFASWNHLNGWLRQIDGLRRAGNVATATVLPVMSKNLIE